MSKCTFCGGENDCCNSYNQCYFCYSCVAYNLHTASGGVLSRVKEDGIVTFWDSVNRYSLQNHPNKDLAWGRIKGLQVIPEGPSLDYIKDLEKSRHELEAKVVDLTNDNFDLKARIKDQADAVASDKLVIENNQLKEGLARCAEENKRLHSDLKWNKVGCSNCSVFTVNEIEKIKQQRNDWEKLAGEYRFKAEKLREQVKELEIQVKDLNVEIEELDQENDELNEESCELSDNNIKLTKQVEDLDVEAEQYFQENKKLKKELADWEYPILNFYRYLDLKYPVRWINIDFSKL